MALLAPPILVAGGEPLARRVHDALRAAGRKVRRIDLQRLGRLGPGRCSLLVLASPSDPVGVVRTLSDSVTGRRQPLRVVLMLFAGAAVTLPEDARWPDGPLLIESVSIEERAARSLIARWPLHLGIDPLFGQPPHLLIAGFGAASRAFLVHALRLMPYGVGPPLITIVDADPTGAASWLERCHPHAGEVADVRCLGPDLAGLDPSIPPSLALVCVDPPEQGLVLAQTIARVAGGCAPILLEVGDAEPDGELPDWDGRIVPISFLAEVCRAEIILDGEGDELARTIHEHYIDTIAAQGRDPAAEAAGQPWEALPDSYREANRHQADHISAKLAVTDCRVMPEERVQSFAFAPLEVERLAVIEHDRWCADRYMDGWSYAPVRDNSRKHHPQLIRYDDLSAPMKDLDRFAVRGLPALLARSGLGVVRMLIVGVPDPGPGCPDGYRFAALVDALVERLVARYPDRALIVASTLADTRARLIVRRAIDYGGAGLFILCPRPIERLLEAQDPAGRIELLGLIARAERRIPLAGDPGLEAWLGRRAEVRLMLGEGGAAVTDAKWVCLGASAVQPEWGFEY